MDPVTAVLGGSVVQTIASAREAEKNRKFQERMSSTAHQREVSDLKAAGLNPLLSVMRGSGASSPSGAVGQVADFGSATAKALDIRLARELQGKQIKLLEAQTIKTHAEAATESARLPGRITLDQMQGRLAAASGSQIYNMMPEIIAKARAEVASLVSSARRADALAYLDELARTGAYNEAEFQKRVGTGGQFLKFLNEALKTLKGAR